MTERHSQPAPSSGVDRISSTSASGASTTDGGSPPGQQDRTAQQDSTATQQDSNTGPGQHDNQDSAATEYTATDQPVTASGPTETEPNGHAAGPNPRAPLPDEREARSDDAAGSQPPTATTVHPPRRRPSRTLVVTAAAAGVAVVGGLGIAAVVGGGDGDTAATDDAGALGATQAISVTTDSCAKDWSLSTTGAAAFAITNGTAKSVEVTLRSTVDDGIIAEIETLPAQLTRQLSTVVNPGSYYWVCQFRGGGSTHSQAVSVTGPKVPVARPLLQVNASDMKGPVAEYRTYVGGQLSLLQKQTALLRADLAAGNAAKARSDWLTAHQTYHRVGAAYDAFGDLGDSVDGLTQGLSGGVNDPDFTGFHKIEHLLWSGADPRSIVPEADALAKAAGTLLAKLPSFTLDPNDISLRTHEILEGTARFQFTGEDDYGSGSSLATAQADIDGTRKLVTILTPLIQTRDKDLPERLDSQLDELESAVQATKSGGVWKPVQETSLAQRQRINAAAGALLESLSVVPDMLEIRG